MASGFTVVTLNIWGLWLVSKKRQERVRHLGEWLASTTADVVLLQEVWMQRDAQLLMRCAARGGLQHSMHFQSGIFGSGLVTCSRWPISSAMFFRYSAAGSPAAFSCGDYYAGKGVGWARLRAPAGELDVFNTHLHANYSHRYSQAQRLVGADQLSDLRIPGDSFAPYRVAQMAELAQIIAAYSGPDSIGTVLGGDLNSKPGTLEIALLQAQLPALADSWHAVHPLKEGFTCKSPVNSWQPKRQVPERIDFVYSTLRCASCELTLNRCPSGCSYSDHLGVQATLLWPAKAGPSTPHPAHAAGGTEGVSAAKRRQQVLDVAAALLAWGVAGNRSSSTSRLLAAGFLLLLAMVLDISLLSLLRPEQLAYMAGTGVLLLTNLVLAAGAAVSFVMGMVGDATQAQVLSQARSQLMLQMSNAK